MYPESERNPPSVKAWEGRVMTRNPSPATSRSISDQRPESVKVLRPKLLLALNLLSHAR